MLEKLTAFFNKYFTLSSAPVATETLQPLKLDNVEDDDNVRNLIFNRLTMNADTTDYELKREVMEEYGQRYPDMKDQDWQRIIADYTPMVREASKPRIISMGFDKAAEDSLPKRTDR